MSKDILPTVDKQADTYHKLQFSIYKNSKLDTNVLRDSIRKVDRIAYMRQEFDTIRRETKGQLKIVEKDQSSGGTNVIFRKEVDGKLSGKGTERLFHGQTVELVGNEKNEGGYYEIGEGRNGEKHVYIKVKTENGETGFIAAEHLGYEKIPDTSSIKPEPVPEAPIAPTGLATKDSPAPTPGTGEKASDTVSPTLVPGTGKAEKDKNSLDPGTGEDKKEKNPTLETGLGNVTKNPSRINTGTSNSGEQGSSNKEVPKKVETPAEKTKREQEVRKQLQDVKENLQKGANKVSGIANEVLKGLGTTAGSMLDKAYDLKKNGDKVKAEKWQESWKKETAMPEPGTLLRKTETPQTNSKNQQEKPRPQIMQGLETDAATSTERPLEKTDSETKNTTQDYTPIIESKDKGTLARELGSGLASTFRVLAVDETLADSVSNLLVDQNFNLVLDSGEPLNYFRFNEKSIESKWFGKQEIIGLEVQGKALIITQKNGEKLSFAPPKR